MNNFPASETAQVFVRVVQSEANQTVLALFEVGNLKQITRGLSTYKEFLCISALVLVQEVWVLRP